MRHPSISEAYSGYRTLPELSDLRATGANFVPGDGPVPCRIMFVGEAPGQREDEQERPFVGPSGKLLDELLGDIALSRGSVYVTNIVKYRPPKNRNPTWTEIEASKVCLRAEIVAVGPSIICLLGRFALQTVFPDRRIGKSHGELINHRGRFWLPLYHPSYGVRNRAVIPQMEQDIKKLRGWAYLVQGQEE